MTGALAMRAWGKVRLWWELARPFTLLAPAIGAVAGGIAALGAWPRPDFAPGLAAKIGLAALMAANLNGASNFLNQVCDITADRVNKPERPLPSGRVGRREALGGGAALYCLGLAQGWAVGRECLLLGAMAAFASYAYSAPPLRAKRCWVSANLTIGVARGLLLIVAGWSAVRSVGDWEPWFLGGILGLFLFGAAATKDFPDVEGDLTDGSYTLPVVYGGRGAAKIMLPFLSLPFLLLPLGVVLGVLSADGKALTVLGGCLFIWGIVLGRSLLVSTASGRVVMGRSAWIQMYLMLMVAQLGMAATYWV